MSIIIFNQNKNLKIKISFLLIFCTSLVLKLLYLPYELPLVADGMIYLPFPLELVLLGGYLLEGLQLIMGGPIFPVFGF